MPRRNRVALPATRAKSPLPLRVHGVCVACGSRNVIRFRAKSAQVQCRVCGVVSPDFIQPKAPSGYPEGSPAEPLDAGKVHEMLDEMLDALSHEPVKRKLQTQLRHAYGDVALICYNYVPVVVDVCALVVAKYGFTATTEGVVESLRVVQRHATSEDDGRLTAKLIRLRRVFTPTGEWINADAEADAADLKRLHDEQEKQRQQQEEVQRMAELAADNAKKARLRAKKLALGLDPSVPRQPLLDATPARSVLMHANARIELRVVARFTLQFQWFLNGKPLPADDDEHQENAGLYCGTRRSTLTVRHLTKRSVGEYYCVCTNEEGAVSSPSTRVQIVALASQRLTTRKLKTIPAGASGGSLVALTMASHSGTRNHSNSSSTPSPPPPPPPNVIAVCVGGTLLLLHARTLAPVKTLPPLALPSGAMVTAATWLFESRLLIVATATVVPTTAKSSPPPAPPLCELLLYSLELPAAPSPSASVASSPSTSVASSTPSKRSAHPAKPVVSAGGSPTAQPPPPPPQVLLLRHLATHRIITLHRVHCLRFLDGGRQLLVSDHHANVVVYELAPALACKRSLRFDQPHHPLCHVATTTVASTPRLAGAFAGFALCFRNSPRVELYDGNDEGHVGQRTLVFRSAVHRVAFDREGFTLAVAESSGCLKSWISIVSVASSIKAPTATSSKRFVAHVGKVSGLSWTEQSSLLLTSGHDGYVKLWDLEAAAEGDASAPTCVFRVHLDLRGVHSLLLLQDVDRRASDAPMAWLAMGFSDCRLHAREMPLLREFEAARISERDRTAAQIQKIWKGRRTRELINKFIRPAAV